MKKLICLLLVWTSALAADNIIGPDQSGNAYLKSNTGTLYPLAVGYTTNGNSHVLTLNGATIASDDIITPTNSGLSYLKDNLSRLLPLEVLMTTDGNGNVIPVTGGGSPVTPGGTTGAIQFNNGSGGFAGGAGTLSNSGFFSGSGANFGQNIYVGGSAGGGNWTIQPDGSATFADNQFSIFNDGSLTMGGSLSLPNGSAIFSGSITSDSGGFYTDGMGDLTIGGNLGVSGYVIAGTSLQTPSLLDSGGNVALSPYNYALEGPGGIQLLNWSNQEMYDTSNNLSIDWSSYRGLYDSSGQPSIDWNDRQLKQNGFPVIDWSETVYNGASFDNNAAGFNGGGGLTVQALLSDSYVNGQTLNIATSASIGAVSIDSGGDINTSGDIASSYIQSPGLIDSSRNVSVDPYNRKLFDSSGTTSEFGWTTSGVQIPKVVTSYNGVTTAGFGVPIIVGNASLTAQAASIAATSLATAAAGLYRLSGYVECTTAGTAGDTLTVYDIYHDDNASHTNTLVSAMSMSAAGYTAISPQIIRSSASQLISYQTTLSSVAGAPKYALFLTLERLQ